MHILYRKVNIWRPYLLHIGTLFFFIAYCLYKDRKFAMKLCMWFLLASYISFSFGLDYFDTKPLEREVFMEIWGALICKVPGGGACSLIALGLSPLSSCSWALARARCCLAASVSGAGLSGGMIVAAGHKCRMNLRPLEQPIFTQPKCLSIKHCAEQMHGACLRHEVLPGLTTWHE